MICTAQRVNTRKNPLQVQKFMNDPSSQTTFVGRTVIFTRF